MFLFLIIIIIIIIMINARFHYGHLLWKTGRSWVI